MKTALFIRCHAPDAGWLEWCLKSIKRFATGFEYVLVVVPDRDLAVFKPLVARYGCRLHPYAIREGKPMLSGEVQLCTADLICPEADAFCLIDSDTMWTMPVNPLDYFVGGKPRLLGQSFVKLRAEKYGGVVWQDMAERALGFAPTHETMCLPTIFLRQTFALFRAAVEKHVGKDFSTYVLGCQESWPQGFSELTSLGAIAMTVDKDNYFFFDLHSSVEVKADSGVLLTVNKLKQWWSHDPINVAEMENILK